MPARSKVLWRTIYALGLLSAVYWLANAAMNSQAGELRVHRRESLGRRVWPRQFARYVRHQLYLPDQFRSRLLHGKGMNTFRLPFPLGTHANDAGCYAECHAAGLHDSFVNYATSKGDYVSLIHTTLSGIIRLPAIFKVFERLDRGTVADAQASYNT